MSPLTTSFLVAIAATAAAPRLHLAAAQDTEILNALLVCDEAACTANTTFILPSAQDVVRAILSLRVSGNLGTAAQTINVEVNGIVVGTCGAFGEECTTDWVPCLDPTDVIDVDDQAGDTLELTIQTTASVDTLCNTSSLVGDAIQSPIDQATVVVEATLNVTTAFVTPSPTSSCVETHTASPYQPIATLGDELAIAQFDDDVQTILLPFAFPWLTGASIRAITVTTNGQLNLDDNRDSGCCDPVPVSADFADTNVAERIAVAQSDLDPSVSGSIWYLVKPASVIISYEGVRFFSSTSAADDIYYDYTDDTYYDDENADDEPTGPGIINAQVELFADGAIEIRYGEGDMAGNEMASGVQSLSQGIYLPFERRGDFTDGVTASWPTNQGARFLCTSRATAPPSISLSPTLAPTIAPTKAEISTLTLTATDRCFVAGCSGSVTLEPPPPSSDDMVLSFAVLNVSVGGDLGDSGESLSIFIGNEEEPRASCGELMRDDCNLPEDLPCLADVDVTLQAQSGLVEVNFETTELVNAFCYYNGFVGVAAIMEVTLVLFYDKLSTAPTGFSGLTDEPNATGV